MMHSDFYALSACAISVLYIPFLIIAQLRFSHILQNEGYRNSSYLLWIRKNFMLSFFPLIGVCAIVILGRVVMEAYLNNTALFEMEYIYGFFVVLMVIAAAAAFVYYKYVKTIKIESENTPIVCSSRLISIFLISCMLVCALALVVNLVEYGMLLVFFIPLLSPLLVPLANALLGGKRTVLQEEG